MDHIWGIDYGARRSGNTAVALVSGDRILFFQTEKGADSDRWLESLSEKYPPALIAIDAPLSLPKGWCGGKGDLFYRNCDSELKAMSPLFLGGLTARAVNFKRSLREKRTEVIECYPKGFVQKLLGGNYPDPGENSDNILQQLPDDVKLKIEKQPANEHQLDALLCLMIAIRYEKGIAKSFGSPDEGVIWV